MSMEAPSGLGNTGQCEGSQGGISGWQGDQCPSCHVTGHRAEDLQRMLPVGVGADFEGCGVPSDVRREIPGCSQGPFVIEGCVSPGRTELRARI